jgi:hypothetical protein
MTSSDYWEPPAAASVSGETAVSAFALPVGSLNPRLSSPVAPDDTCRRAGEVEGADAEAGGGGGGAATGGDIGGSGGGAATGEYDGGGGGGAGTADGAGGAESSLDIDPDG